MNHYHTSTLADFMRGKIALNWHAGEYHPVSLIARKKRIVAVYVRVLFVGNTGVRKLAQRIDFDL